jgi:hypothetical protein
MEKIIMVLMILGCSLFANGQNQFTGNIVSAKYEIETPERIFTDYFNMMKLNGE